MSHVDVPCSVSRTRMATSVPALDRLTAITTELRAPQILARIESFRRRITAGRFYVACVGQFKRGKSTLLNALVGQPILPTGILPLTAVPTVLQYGETSMGLIRLATGESRQVSLADLERCLPAAGDPVAPTGVEAVEVFLPHPLLRDGLCLVDTPGLGSVFEENSGITRAFVPQIDAALVVIGADPPLAADELRLIKTAAHHVRHLIVVLNKADRFTQRERREAIRFAQGILSRDLGGSAWPILEISAAERLAGHGPLRDWPRLLDCLQALTIESGQVLVGAALRRGITQLAAQCNRVLDETYASLWRPIEESEQRIDRLIGYQGDFADQWLRLSFAMEAEERRLADEARDRRHRFFQTTVPDSAVELERGLARAGLRTAASLRRSAFRLARAIARERLVPWLEAECQSADAEYRRLIERFVAQARGLLSRPAELADLHLGELAQDLDLVEQIRVPSRVDLTASGPPFPPPSVPPLQRWLDCVAPFGRRRVVVAEATRYLERLLREGAALVHEDHEWRVACSRKLLVESVHSLLESVHDSVRHGVERARLVREAGHTARNRELARLEAMRHDVLALLKHPAR